MRIMKKMMLVAAILFAISAYGYAQDDSPLMRDDIIQADVVNLIGNSVHYTVYDILNVKVNDGVVTLGGYLTEPHKKSSIIKSINKHIPAVKQVVDNVTVLPPSANDDRLRYILVRKIYGDSRLQRYTLDRWPYPIHIIVKNGKVKLEGTTRNKYDNRLIEFKVRDTFGVLSVENNLKVS
jgi:hypothetical protein